MHVFECVGPLLEFLLPEYDDGLVGCFCVVEFGAACVAEIPDFPGESFEFCDDGDEVVMVRFCEALVYVTLGELMCALTDASGIEYIF